MLRSSITRIGGVYDWRREVRSHDPEYIRWTQWIFLKLFEAGLAYRKAATVNWCPGCQTVLANEQVVRRPLRALRATWWSAGTWSSGTSASPTTPSSCSTTWTSVDWPERVVTQQRNWIGRSEGAEFEMAVVDADGAPTPGPEGAARPGVHHPTRHQLRHDLLRPGPGAPPGGDDHHPGPGRRGRARSSNGPATPPRSTGCRPRASLSDRGCFTGAYALNPFTGRPVPVYLADYVLATYGTGAVMAVPGEDQRDWDFATQFGLPIIETVQRPDGWDGEAYTGDGAARELVRDRPVRPGPERPVRGRRPRQRRWTGWRTGSWASRTVNFRLRDWLVSRQRFWGCPIPVVYCDDRRRRPGAARTSCRCWLPTTSSSRRPASRPCSPTRASCTRPARAAAARRAARPTRWTPSWTAPGTSCGSVTRGRPSCRSGPRRWR